MTFMTTTPGHKLKEWGRRLTLAALAFATVVTLGCRRTPDYVIPEDDMAELMADIHTAEGVVEMNYNHWGSDSSRQALKQAVLERHGYTTDDLDTSMMWYGAHPDRYMEVYDNTISILEERYNRSSAIAAADAAISVSGDSVDIWSQGRRFAISPRSVSNMLSFRIRTDANSKPGDSYTWRAKFFNGGSMSRWGIVADYQDGTTEILMSSVMGEGWSSLTFFADSTRMLKDIYGYLEVHPGENAPVYLDSVQLVRNRLNRQTYMQRYRQRSYRLNN